MLTHIIATAYAIAGVLTFVFIPRDYKRDTWLNVIFDLLVLGLFWPVIWLVIGVIAVREYLASARPPTWLQ